MLRPDSANLSRRACLVSANLTAAGSLLGQAPQVNRPRPNIIWILSEDISPNLGCYGEPLIQTPNIDKLAAGGVRFTRAYTTAPVCSPSRSAIITGQYQTRIGAHNHRTVDRKPLLEPARLVTDRLREAGYFTVLSSPGAKRVARQPTGQN